MANVYVRSGAGGAGTGADWANAYTTLAAAMTGGANGDDFWVAGDHAETQASAMTITCKGTPASPCRVMCVNHAGTVPPIAADLLATATISTTGANHINIVSGVCYFRGITFQSGSAASTASIIMSGTSAAFFHTYDTCVLKLNNTSPSSVVTIGGGGLVSYGRVDWIRTKVNHGTVGQVLRLGNCAFNWRNTVSALAGAVPTVLFGYWSGGGPFTATIDGVDLSPMVAGKTLVSAVLQAAKFIFKDCSLGSGPTIASGLTSTGGCEVYVNRADNAAVAYRQEKYQYAGTETMETTIVRTGGASVNGTPIAKKYVTTADAKFAAPFEAIPLAVANSVIGTSRVVTVYGIWDGGAVPDNDDIWMEVDYLGSASNPLATTISTAKATPLTTASGYSSDSSTWGGSTTKFKMTATLTGPQPQLAGDIYVRIFCGAASSTFYIDPAVELS